MSTTDGELSIPTSIPCPPWCALPPGHGWDSTHGQQLGRFHESRPFQARHVTEYAEQVTPPRLAAAEYADDVHGPVTERGPVEVFVTVDGEFTGPACRAIAATLLNAADAWDEARSGA